MQVSSRARTGTTSGSSARYRSGAPTSGAGSARARWCWSAARTTRSTCSRTAARTAARGLLAEQGRGQVVHLPVPPVELRPRGRLLGVPFLRGALGKGGMPADFDNTEHGLRGCACVEAARLGEVRTDAPSFATYLGPEVHAEVDRIFTGRPLQLLGYNRQLMPCNWKLYVENLHVRTTRPCCTLVPDVRPVAHRHRVGARRPPAASTGSWRRQSSAPRPADLGDPPDGRAQVGFRLEDTDPVTPVASSTTAR